MINSNLRINMNGVGLGIEPTRASERYRAALEMAAYAEQVLPVLAA